MKLAQKRIDSERTKIRMQEKLVAERDKVEREMRHRMLAEKNNLMVSPFNYFSAVYLHNNLHPVIKIFL